MINIKANNKIGILLPFLLTFYIVYRVFANNIIEVRLMEFLLILSIYIIICLLILLLLRLLLKDYTKAGLLTSTILFLNATYGLNKYLVWNLSISFFTREILFVVTVCIGMIITIIIIKTKSIRGLLRFYFSFTLVLILFSTITLVYNIFTSTPKSLDSKSDLSVIGLGDIHLNQYNKRDVYFIILDAYSGHKHLKETFGFDNSKFVNELRERGFFVPENSKCNYAFTQLSLPSTLNMTFYSDTIVSKKETRHLFMNNIVFQIFSQLGYKTNSLTYGCYLPPIKYSDYKYRTVITQFAEEIVLETYTGEVALRTFLTANAAERTFKSYEVLHKIAERSADDYMFTYAHLYTTHGPYVFTANGDLYENVSMEWLPEKNIDRYFDAIKYTNKRILTLVDSILVRDPTPVIIIQADHGNLSKTPGVSFHEQSINILNAFYFPDGDYSLLSNTITSVNTFRVFFKKYYNPQFELLEDKSSTLVVDLPNYHIIELSQPN